MTLEDAFSHVKSKRSVINPNHGFMSQLKAYEGILNARYGLSAAKSASSTYTRGKIFININLMYGRICNKYGNETGMRRTMEHGGKKDKEDHICCKLCYKIGVV